MTLNRAMTAQLAQVSALTGQVKASLTATTSLAPLLDQLQGALAGVTTTAGRAGGSATVSQATLGRIGAALDGLAAGTATMASTSAGIPAQESAVVASLRGMVADLQASLASVRRIRQLFDPGPPA